MDRAFAGYALLAMLMGGCFVVIILGIGNPDPAWAILTGAALVLTREIGGSSDTRRYIAAQAAQPTITTTSGPPATATVTPAEGP